MYKFLNVHPEGKLVPDCVKRAITVAANMDYRDVKIELNRHKKLTGAKTFNEDKNWKSYVINVLDGKWISFPATKGLPRMNGERFCKAFPKGNYILSMAGHLSCCVDGVIYDTWDCTNKTVYGAYKIDVDKLPFRYFRIIRDKDMTYISLRANYHDTENKYEVANKDISSYRKCLRDLGFKEKR